MLAALRADRYERGLFRGTEGAQDFAAQAAKLEQRLDDLQGRIATAAPATRYEPTGETVAEVWDRADADERRSLLAQRIAHITIGPSSRGRPGGVDASRVDVVTHEDEDPALVAVAPDGSQTPGTVRAALSPRDLVQRVGNCFAV